jgi:hypothetical protein
MRRNLAIFCLARDGWSQRMIADVFDLRQSRIAAIIAEITFLYDESDQIGIRRDAARKAPDRPSGGKK